MASNIQMVGTTLDSTKRLEVQLDGMPQVEIPTVQSGYVEESVELQAGKPLKMVVTNDADPPGNATLTGEAGRASIAAGAAAVVITRAGTTTATKCFAQKLLLDATATDFKVVCTANTITITANAAATADLPFDYFVIEAA